MWALLFLVKPTVSSVGPEQKSLRTGLVFPCSEASARGTELPLAQRWACPASGLYKACETIWSGPAKALEVR